LASSRGDFPGYHEICIVAVPYFLNARPDLHHLRQLPPGAVIASDRTTH